MTQSINPATITKAIETALRNKQSLNQCMITRGEPVNEDPSCCPWIGIYRREFRYLPRTLGAGAGNREFTGEFVLAIQETSLDSGADCEDLLDELIKEAIDAILDDPTLRSSVDMVNECAAAYSYDALFAPQMNEMETSTHYYQTAYIQMTMEAKTG